MRRTRNSQGDGRRPLAAQRTGARGHPRRLCGPARTKQVRPHFLRLHHARLRRPPSLQLAHAKCPDTPFLFVSGTIGEDTAIEALKNGATDYVLKHRLMRLIRRWTGRCARLRNAPNASGRNPPCASPSTNTGRFSNPSPMPPFWRTPKPGRSLTPIAAPNRCSPAPAGIFWAAKFPASWRFGTRLGPTIPCRLNAP